MGKKQKAGTTKEKLKEDKRRKREGSIQVGIASPNGHADPDVSEDITPFKDRQRALKNGYRENPRLARQVSAVQSVTPADAEIGKVRIAIENKAGVIVDIGAHHSVGGIEDVGCSGDYFLASLAGCYEVTLRLVAAASKLTINRLDLRIEGDWDARGTLGIDRDVPVGFTSLRIVVDIDADGPPERIARLGELTERYCVVSQTLKHPPMVHVRHRGVLLPRYE